MNSKWDFLRARLHQTSESLLRQLRDDASETVVTLGVNGLYGTHHQEILRSLSLSLGVNGPQVFMKFFPEEKTKFLIFWKMPKYFFLKKKVVAFWCSSIDSKAPVKACLHVPSPSPSPSPSNLHCMNGDGSFDRQNYSAIHKATGQVFSRLERPSETRSCWRLYSRLMGVSGIVPGKIMERPGTVRLAALRIALLVQNPFCPSNGLFPSSQW